MQYKHLKFNKCKLSDIKNEFKISVAKIKYDTFIGKRCYITNNNLLYKTAKMFNIQIKYLCDVQKIVFI